MDDNESEEPDKTHSLLCVSWNVKYDTTLVRPLPGRLVEVPGNLLGESNYFQLTVESVGSVSHTELQLAKNMLANEPSLVRQQKLPTYRQ